MLDMYGKIWEEGDIPETWKHTTITPLLKKEQLKRCKELQTSSSNKNTSKIFERMTKKRLVWYQKKKKKIDERQFGFRNQGSTIDAISKVTIKILDGFIPWADRA